MESESGNKDQVIADLRDTERDLRRQIDSLHQTLQLKDSEVSRITGKMETSAVYAQTLEKEVAEWRAKVESLNQQVHSGQTDTIQSEHKRNQNEIQIYDLKQTVTQLKQECQKQCADLSLAKKDLCEERQKNQSLG